MLCSWGFSSDFAGKNGRGDDEECTSGRVRERSVCMCVVLTKKEKEKENKRESDRPKREKREWIVCWVVGLGGEHVGTKQSNLFFFFFNLWDVTPMTLYISMWMHVYGIKIRQHKINEQPYVCKQDYAHVSFCSETLETQQRLKTLNLTS